MFRSPTFCLLWKQRSLLPFVPSAAKGQLAKTPEVFSTSIPHPPLLSPALASSSLCNKYHPLLSPILSLSDRDSSQFNTFHVKHMHIFDKSCFFSRFVVDLTVDREYFLYCLAKYSDIWRTNKQCFFKSHWAIKNKFYCSCQSFYRKILWCNLKFKFSQSECWLEGKPTWGASVISEIAPSSRMSDFFSWTANRLLKNHSICYAHQ